MGKRNTILNMFLTVAVLLPAVFSCTGGSPRTAEPSAKPAIKVEERISQDSQMIEVIVNDATGEILGVKANEVGDFFIINPQNEQIIPMQGHSVREITIGEYEKTLK